MIHEKNEKVSMSLFLMGIGGFFALLSGGMIVITKFQQFVMRAIPEDEVPETFPVLHGLVLEHMPWLFALAIALVLSAVIRYFIKNDIVKKWSLGFSTAISIAIAVWMIFYSVDTAHFSEVMTHEMGTDLPYVFEAFTNLTRVLGIVFVIVIFSLPLILHLMYFIEGMVLSKQGEKINSAP